MDHNVRLNITSQIAAGLSLFLCVSTWQRDNATTRQRGSIVLPLATLLLKCTWRHRNVTVNVRCSAIAHAYLSRCRVVDLSRSTTRQREWPPTTTIGMDGCMESPVFIVLVHSQSWSIELKGPCRCLFSTGTLLICTFVFYIDLGHAIENPF